MSFDLTNKNISDTYQNLLQKTGSSGQLYDLVGNTVKDLTIQGTLHAQSYIVSESVVVATSGSTIFGNSTDDTHQFTGSISSTGNVNVKGKLKQDNIEIVLNTNTGSFLTSVQPGANQGVITKTSQDVVGAVISIPGLTTSGNPKFNHITASGDISSSGTINANNAQFGPLSVHIDGLGGHLTASGDISSSGTIVGSNLSGTNTGDQDLSTYIQNSQTGSFLTSIPEGTYSSSLQTLTNITASGNISSSGVISASGFSTTGIVSAEQLTSTDDAFVGDKLSIGTSQTAYNLSVDGTSNFKNHVQIDEDVEIRFDTGTETFIKANSDNPEDLEIHADQDILLKPDRSVGIGTDNPPQLAKLAVEGNISGSNMLHLKTNQVGSTAANVQLVNHSDQLSIPGITLGSGSDSIDIKARFADDVSFVGVLDGEHSPIGSLRFSSSYGGNVVFDYSKEATVPYVGIGNSFPTKPLTVQGDISSSGYVYADRVFLEGNDTLRYSTANSGLYVGGGIQTTGESTFGNLTTDIHTFNGNITASGNISSSGNIESNILKSNGQNVATLISDQMRFGNTNNETKIFADNEIILGSDTTANAKLSVNTTHISSGSFSVNYGDGATMTGSVGTLGHGYGDITEIGGGTISAGRIHALEEDGDWALSGETGPISSSLLCIGLGDGKKLLRGTVNVSTAGDTTIGQKVYGGASGRVSAAAPSDSGDVVRVLGYTLSGSVGGNGAKIYFNPDNTWVEVS